MYMMPRWPFKVESYLVMEVQEYCVRDAEWQKFRKSLKGLNTLEKLYKLQSWILHHPHQRRAQVQVDNYINALKRGGQLDMEGNIKR